MQDVVAPNQKNWRVIENEIALRSILMIFCRIPFEEVIQFGKWKRRYDMRRKPVQLIKPPHFITARYSRPWLQLVQKMNPLVPT